MKTIFMSQIISASGIDALERALSSQNEDPSRLLAKTVENVPQEEEDEIIMSEDYTVSSAGAIVRVCWQMLNAVEELGEDSESYFQLTREPVTLHSVRMTESVEEIENAALTQVTRLLQDLRIEKENGKEIRYKPSHKCTHSRQKPRLERRRQLRHRRDLIAA